MPDRAGDGAGGALVVAGEQHRAQAHGAQPGDRLGRGGLDRVGHDEHAADLAVPGDEGTTVCPAACAACAAGWPATRRERLAPTRPASQPGRPDRARRARPRRAETPGRWVRAKSLHGGQAGRRAGPGAPHAIAAAIGCSDAVLHGAGEPQQLAARPRRARRPRRSALIRPVVTVPVLSSTMVSTPPGGLQHLGALDQDAELRAAAGADQDRGRGGQAHRARAGDDQHRDRGGERRSPAVCPAASQPSASRRRARARRDEHRGDPVREPLHRRLARLRLGDQPGHLGELGVRADPGGADHAAARRRSRSRRSPRRPGPTSTGTGSPVSIEVSTAELPGDDDAVGGDLLPRPDHELVADRELRRPGPRPRAVAQHRASLAPRSSSARSAAPARRLARASRYRPSRISAVTPAATSR